MNSKLSGEGARVGYQNGIPGNGGAQAEVLRWEATGAPMRPWCGVIAALEAGSRKRETH